MKSFLNNITENIKSKKNLYFESNFENIEDFKIGTLNSNLIFLHSEINSRTVTKINQSGNKTLYIDIALYDIKSGELVLKKKIKSKTKFEKEAPEEKELIKKLSEEVFKAVILELDKIKK